MFTWISRAALVTVLLSGCVGPDFGDGFAGLAAPSTTMRVSGDVVIAGPPGFCALKQTRSRPRSAEFVALTRCGTGREAGAVLTATIGEAETAIGLDLTGKGLRGYFASAEGRRALSRTQNPNTVKVHQIQDQSGAVLVRFADRSAGGTGDGWRAVMSARGRLVTLSVRAVQGKQLSASQGQKLISGFVQAMRRANSP